MVGSQLYTIRKPATARAAAAIAPGSWREAPLAGGEEVDSEAAVVLGWSGMEEVALDRGVEVRVRLRLALEEWGVLVCGVKVGVWVEDEVELGVGVGVGVELDGV